MKAIYFLRTLVATLLMCCVAAVNAADLPVTDEATFKQALESAVFADKIIVSSEIVLSEPVTINKNVRIFGEGTAAGFSGDGKTKLFIVDFGDEPSSVEGETILFSKLKLTNGYSEGEPDVANGGIARILGGSVYFIDCQITDGYTNRSGGAMNIANAGTYVKFYNCQINNNQAMEGMNAADGTTNAVGGGAFFIQGGAAVDFEYCNISGNKTGDRNNRGGRGGAFFIDGGGTAVNMFYCSVMGNATSWIDLNLGSDATPEDLLAAGEGHGGGAFCVNGDMALTLTATSVAGNSSLRGGSHGGAFFGMGAYNVTLINSIVTGNTHRGAGSFFMATDSGILTMVNSNWIRNTAYDNPGNGAGLRIMNLGNGINLINSILAGNLCNQDGAVDITPANTEGIENLITIKHSYIGSITSAEMIGATARFQARVEDSEVGQPSKINEHNITEANAALDWQSVETQAEGFTDFTPTGLDFMEATFSTLGLGRRWQALTIEPGWAATAGDPALLENELFAIRDFMNEEREPNADGSISAGPLSGNYNLNEVESIRDRIPAYEGFPIDPGTSISTPIAVEQDINVNVIEGVVYINYGSLRGKAQGNIISLNGQIVENLFNTTVVANGVYPTKVAKGTYILNVTVDGQNFAKTIIVK